jgi:PAS domain S-box-containing protein
MHASTDGSSFERILKLLLVENSPFTARVISEQLKKCSNIRLDASVPRLSDALRAIRDQFDVILLDLNLDDSGGYETFTAIQRAFPKSAILILSSTQDEELAAATVRHGAQDYLLKGSFNSKLLVRCIRHAYERKKILEALKNSELTARAIFENSLDATLIVDDLGCFLEANGSAAELFGVPRGHLLGRRFSEFGIDDSTAQWSRFLQARKSRERLRIKECSQQADRIVDCCFVANILPRQHLLVMRDITEQQKLEDDLHESQKLEAVGRLAGGVAHDFNNVLAIITAYAELLQRDLERNPMQDRAEKILSATQRAASLVNQLLAFGRKQLIAPEVLDVSSVVMNLASMLRRLVGTDVHVSIDAPKDVGYAKIDRGQLEQVIINLVANARDAMPKGGILAIRVEKEVLSRRVRGIPPGNYVLLSLADSGIGMDKWTQEHLFEPYFTTKQTGHGLGLASVFGIVKQSAGYIAVDSMPGAGTTFRVYFPEINESLNNLQRPQAQPIELTGDETILLVDDEEPLRCGIAEFLETCGFTVLQVRDGSEAVEISESYMGPIHLLISDVVMPGINGGELIARFRAAHPDAQILLISGYADSDIARYEISLKNARFLHKPFEFSQLATTIKDLLAIVDKEM